ncbi:unnamed protein product [Caretta caretta]
MLRTISKSPEAQIGITPYPAELTELRGAVEMMAAKHLALEKECEHSTLLKEDMTELTTASSTLISISRTMGYLTWRQNQKKRSFDLNMDDSLQSSCVN